MQPDYLTQLVGVVVMGGAAQWFAWRLRLPSIVLLLVIGFVAGPVTGLLHPEKLFGELLLPFVSLSVSIILFEGGLSLDFKELRGVGAVVRNLVTVGALVTWVVAAAAAYWIVELELHLAVLLGAILVVTGPTVILPLLRHVRPTRTLETILKWEGIVIDPVGALLAVLVFEVALSGGLQAAPTHVAVAVVKTVLAGGGLGVAAGGLLTLLIARYWIPDFLHNVVALGLVAGTFALANAVQAESGLFAVTIMGIVMANQRYAKVEHIIEFKENLRVFLISAVFILLSARLEIRDLTTLGWSAAGFVAVLILVARPLCVLVSTIRSRLAIRERLFLMDMAPRGIVAAAITSVFALHLEEAGYPDARLLVPLTFVTITGTVLLYGLSASFLARRLRVADPSPQGVLMVGAQPFARAIALALHELGFRIVVVDTNREKITAARMGGLATHHGSIVGERVMESLNLAGIGRLLAMTNNDELNALAVQTYTRILGRANVYQLPPRAAGSREAQDKHLHGRWLFDRAATFSKLEECVERGAAIKATKLSEEFDFIAFRDRNPGAIPMFLIEHKRLTVLPADKPAEPRPGQTLVSLVPPEPV